ncbi:MAG: galactose mutarotase [Planktomarina sp.]
MIEQFGTTKDGEQVDVITIASDDLSVKILTLGAIIHDVRLGGVDHPLTLGALDVAAYQGPLSSFGSLIGPVVNRIKDCTADIKGQTYTFEKHHSGNLTQHSGSTGTHKQIWNIKDRGADHVTLTLKLPDGLGGFPGNRFVTAAYVVDGAALRLTVTATTDAATLMNFANHSYWSLDPTLGFAGQTLTVHADQYTETDDSIIPTGRVLDVSGTQYDLRDGVTLTGDATQFFDWNLCTADARGPLRPVAELRGTGGVSMVMSSTEAGLQVYDCGTINAPDFATHHGQPYLNYSGLALEAQSWPGAERHDTFPTIELSADQAYEQVTQWAFSST